MPKHFFLSSGPFKFVCRVTHLDEKYAHKSSIGSDLSVRPNIEAKAINLSYWETYVEPWLHFSAMLRRSNVRIADDVLAYWSDVAGRELQLEDLETVITATILGDGWNDDVGLGAHDLLTTDV